MPFDIMTCSIVGVSCLDRYIFMPESEIASVCLLEELVGVPILLIKLSLGLITLFLFIFAPKHHLYPFSLPPSIFLWYALFLWTFFLADQVLLP